MFIGSILKERMTSLGFSIETLSEESFVDISIIKSLLSNQISVTELDEQDFNFLCSALICEPSYFLDENIRTKDIVYLTSSDNVQSNLTKAKLMMFANDFAFLKEIHDEVKVVNNPRLQSKA